MRFVIDLQAPDDRHSGRFATELADLLALAFEIWCPDDGTGAPLRSSQRMAEKLADGWREVWFSPDNRAANVTPLLTHPWIRLEPDTWPIQAIDEDDNQLSVRVWPRDPGVRHDAPRFIRVMCREHEAVELRIRPDRARGGRVHLEIKVNSDLYSAEPLQSNGRDRSNQATERSAAHLLVLLGWVEDILVLYAPSYWEAPHLLMGDPEAIWPLAGPASARLTRTAGRAQSRCVSFSESAQRIHPPPDEARYTAARLYGMIARLESHQRDDSITPILLNCRHLLTNAGFRG